MALFLRAVTEISPASVACDLSFPLRDWRFFMPSAILDQCKTDRRPQDLAACPRPVRVA